MKDWVDIDLDRELARIERENAREEAIEEMKQRAQELVADAIIGMKMDYEVLGSDNGMLMVTCSGTAVTFL